MKYLLLLVCVLLVGCGPNVETVTVKDLYSNPVAMNGKTVRLHAVIVGALAHGNIGGKECGWISDTYTPIDTDKATGPLLPPSIHTAVALMPAPLWVDGTQVDVEGVYDGESGVLHATSITPSPKK